MGSAAFVMVAEQLWKSDLVCPNRPGLPKTSRQVRSMDASRAQS